MSGSWIPDTKHNLVPSELLVRVKDPDKDTNASACELDWEAKLAQKRRKSKESAWFEELDVLLGTSPEDWKTFMEVMGKYISGF